VKIKGLDELSKKLDTLAKNAEELDGTHTVSMTDLLTPGFISEHTRFADADELFEASGFKCDSQADFEAIPEDELDKFIQSESSFDSWQDMLGAAGQAWAVKKLGL
jgi:hypothetical protein